MKRAFGFAVAVLVLVPAFSRADDPIKLEDLLGKWELTEAASGIPKGATFEFKKEGKLEVVAELNGKKQTFEFKYELKVKEKVLAFTINNKTDTTAIEKLTDKDLVCKDADGTTAKFKRAK